MLLHKKYNKLLPTETYLTDEVILINAWKKAHQYIRTTSWYVDFLDLDQSAIELEVRIEQLSNKLQDKSLRLSSLTLIPAPKSHPWFFEKEEGYFDEPPSLIWRPKDSDAESDKSDYPIQPMRPLAHISIDDQTVFTALMMLLADKVETVQGDPSVKFEEVHEKGVINYGNRLHCKYVDSQAEYSWGNSNTYSKYFQDYQQFLARPIYFGREAKKVKTNDEEIYEVQLDFSKFYDLVNKTKLTEKISDLILQITNEEPDECLQDILEKFERWNWTPKSRALYKDVCKNEHVEALKQKKGIPQGLVAGGFFANIYLLEFDKKLSKLIGDALDEDGSVVLIDACRYVDDLRLIVKSGKGPDAKENITRIVRSIIEEFIDEDNLGLTLQDKKTKVKVFSSKEGAVSAKLADIQGKLSGPMPLHEMDEQLGHLEGLIELADNLDIRSLDELENEQGFIGELACIDKTFNDVRKDTLLRFTANKIHLLLRRKRNMISQDVNDSGEPIPGPWDYLQERMARKLIANWTKDPSLILLLKKGLELFPHINLLRPVLQSLEGVRQQESKVLKVFAEYCISEILRHSATVIHTKDRWAFPAHSDPDSYFAYLENYASGELSELDNLSEALKEQVLFFCLVRNDSIHKEPVNREPFDLISQLFNGFRKVNLNIKPKVFTTAVILANQLSRDKAKVNLSISCAFEAIYSLDVRPVKPRPKSLTRRTLRKVRSLRRGDLKDICKGIMLANPELFEILYFSAKKLNMKWTSVAYEFAEYLGLNDYSKVKGNLSNYDNKTISLLSVLRTDDNPFKHENGILKLLQSVFVDLDKNNFIAPIDIKNSSISCSNWNDLLQLNSNCDLSITLKYLKEDELLHNPPDWLTDEHKPLYFMGMFIRSCLLGSVDWSRSRFNQNDRSAYYGIKSNMLKRQVGMMHSPEAFGDSKAPMSDWLSSLLFKLLQWPGVKSNGDLYSWPKLWDLDELEKCINQRTEVQSNAFCGLSNIPTYTEKVQLGWPKDKSHLNVVMVQTLLPLDNDFDTYGFELNDPKYRAKHRRHIASVSELILHNIASLDSVNVKPKLKGMVDLIVWPELSVSPDDLDILERLSDKTGAIIFAGIGFSHIKNARELNNAAIWIIPNKSSSGRRFIKRLQGKQNMTVGELSKITPWRPYQLIVELIHPAFENQEGFKLTGSICYDATDIKLSADLKDKSHAYIVSAMNKDVGTFDSMVDALFYHMYQYVVLVNSGEYGGSVAKAPYKEKFDKLITHTHGSHQVAISSFQMNMFDFRECGLSLRSDKKVKTPPAGNLK
ncbi:RNA-directed DNA polymerase [Vibrio salinus]|uniref:RNA-directed DNA polymerase n=1 Tax=Vibrio salinus TaxID=2899784 RepID=UPI001E42AF39|nr:RNA-directed DNA polymerase [Vibrio salinus]MCE0493125.1 RNA-directed DNA polymerase [Vibrio salinus]